MLSFNDIVMQYVWPTTIYLGAISLSIFFSLVFLRFFMDRTKNKTTNRKKVLERQMLIHLTNPLKDLKTILLKTRKDMALVAEIAPALLRTLKGSSYQRLLDSLQSIGLYDWSIKMLHDKNRPQKIAAINLISHWADKHVTQELKALLEDGHPLVRFAALEALANTKDISTLPTIVKEFIRQSNLSIPLMSNILQIFGADISKHLTVLITSPDMPARVKIPALMALVKTDDREQIVLAATMLCWHNDDKLRAMAYLAMSDTGEPVPTNLLQSGAEDENWRIRQSVAICATNSKPLPAAILAKLLRDKNWLVGLRSGQVLFESGVLGIKILKTIAKGTHIGASRAKMILSEHAPVEYQVEYGGEDGLA